MADFSQWWWQAAADPGPGPDPDAGDPINQSLRFRGTQSLSGHTGGSGTASVWIKRAKLGAAQTVMSGIAFDAGDKLNSSVALFRDPSAWMHVVVNANGTYVNGVSVASGSAISAGTIGTSCELYLAAFYFIDGQVLEPTAFGRYNSKGVWVPVDYLGSFGSSGFHLTFEDPSNLGKDVANGNDFTATGFETVDTSSPDYDLMLDSPTQNYATINPLYPGASTSKANLTTANATGKPTILGIAGNVGVDGASVAWDGTEAGWTSTGAINFGQQPSGFNEFSTRKMPAAPIADGRDHFQAITGPGQVGGTFYAEDAGDTADRDVERPLGTLTDPIFSGSGAYTPSGTTTYSWVWDAGGEAASSSFTVDFHGSTYSVRSSLDGINWNTEADAPTGTNTITSTNPHRYVRIQAPNWGVGAGTQTMTSTSGVPILTQAQQTFPNGLWWIKDRVNSNQHQLVDSVRGGNLAVTCPGNSNQAYTAPAGGSVAWCWNAPDAFTPSVVSGTGISNLQGARNVDAGFSIVTFNRDGTTLPATVTHGLSQDPEFVITKNTSGTNSWYTYHAGISTDQVLQLDLSDPAFSVPSYFVVDTANQAFGTGVDGAGPVQSNQVWYLWHSVEGFSKYGSYEGNGDPDGVFVYLSFTPSLVLCKNIDASNSWVIFDTTRNPVNNNNMNALQPNDARAEIPGYSIDLLSNGFKLRDNTGDFNSTANFVYACFAQNPFQAPATAR